MYELSTRVPAQGVGPVKDHSIESEDGLFVHVGDVDSRACLGFVGPVGSHSIKVKMCNLFDHVGGGLRPLRAPATRRTVLPDPRGMSVRQRVPVESMPKWSRGSGRTGHWAVCIGWIQAPGRKSRWCAYTQRVEKGFELLPLERFLARMGARMSPPSTLVHPLLGATNRLSRAK